MADVRPFQAIRYSEAVRDLSLVLCPPYDQITPELQTTLYSRSPYNAVRLEAGLRLPTDSPSDNRNTRTLISFREWLSKHILKQDNAPAFYVVKLGYQYKGHKWSMTAFLGLLRMEEYEKKIVLPHEHTSEAIKQDRLALMQVCHTHFSAIMCMYWDEDRHVRSLIQPAMASLPEIKAANGDGQVLEVWPVRDTPMIEKLREAMSPKQLYIADGHHRYETSLMYRDRRKASDSKWTGEKPANFIMSAFIEMQDPGLRILPYHRLLSGLDMETLERLKKRLHEVFQVHPFNTGGERWLSKLANAVEGLRRKEPVLAVLGLGSQANLLVPRNEASFPGGRTPLSSVDSWILEELVLRPVLDERIIDHLTWVHSGEEALSRVSSGKYQLAFLLKPLSMDAFTAIVGEGMRLPPKSTYFYPKLPTGLAFYSLKD